MDIGALPRRFRPFSLTKSMPLKSRTKHNTGVRVPFSTSGHEKPVFVVGSLVLGLCRVLKINDRNYGNQNKKDLGEQVKERRGVIRRYFCWGRGAIIIFCAGLSHVRRVSPFRPLSLRASFCLPP